MIHSVIAYASQMIYGVLAYASQTIHGVLAYAFQIESDEFGRSVISVCVGVLRL